MSDLVNHEILGGMFVTNTAEDGTVREMSVVELKSPSTGYGVTIFTKYPDSEEPVVTLIKLSKVGLSMLRIILDEADDNIEAYRKVENEVPHNPV